MHINNPDALKSWLTIILEPLCDADPAALSRYVLALLKKDKPVKDLLECMAEQLDVFLGNETKPFLDRLFVIIKSEDYLKVGDDLAPATILQTIKTDLIENENRECTPPIGDNKAKDNANKHEEISPNSVQIIGQIGTGTVSVSTIVPAPIISKSHESSPTKIISEKENNIKEIRRRRISLRSRSRSRSRSYDRARRSRSRERRVSDREKTSRQFRNKSPPPPTRRYERRAERSPRSYGRIRHHSGSRSRSGSQERIHKISRSMSPSNDEQQQLLLQQQQTSSASKRLRCRDFDEKGYCMRGETCPWDHGVDPVVLEDINNPALISIQSSGPHSRGEYSPDNPDLWNRGGNFMGPRGGPPHRTSGTSAGGGNISGSGGSTYPRNLTQNFRGCPPFPFNLAPSGVTTPLQRELIPVPVVDGNNTISGNSSGNSGGDPSSSLNQIKRRFEPEDSVAIGETTTLSTGGGGGIGPIRRNNNKLSINNRLGPRINLQQQQNCSLELRKVPRGLNTISHLNNHFIKFGKIINIQISYDNDPEAAIIQFSTHAEANVAYRSTEAVLNNRFIKVFWHSSANNNEQQQQQQTILNKEDLQSRRIYQTQHTINNIPAIPTTINATETINDIGKTTTAGGGTTLTTTTSTTSNILNNNLNNINNNLNNVNNQPNPYTTTNNITTGTTSLVNNSSSLLQAQRIKNNRINRATAELIRKKQDEHVKTAVQLAHGLHKRKHDLLQEYIKQMRSALELVERIDITDPKRIKLLQTIKDLQTTIDKLRKEITIEQTQITQQIQNQIPIKKSKEQQQKELLDIELELITQQQEGNDTTAIQKKLYELQRIYNSGNNINNNNNINNINKQSLQSTSLHRTLRVRPPPHGSTSVDRRPTCIQIVGFNIDDSDSLLGHFKHFGEITKNQLDKTIPSLTISYATRSNAEQAMLRGRMFKDKRIQITWATPAISIPLKPDVIIADTIDNPTVSSELRLDDDDDIEEEEEEEEEDAESEDRTWRR